MRIILDLVPLTGPVFLKLVDILPIASEFGYTVGVANRSSGNPPEVLVIDTDTKAIWWPFSYPCCRNCWINEQYLDGAAIVDVHHPLWSEELVNYLQKEEKKPQPTTSTSPKKQALSFLEQLQVAELAADFEAILDAMQVKAAARNNPHNPPKEQPQAVKQKEYRPGQWVISGTLVTIGKDGSVTYEVTPDQRLSLAKRVEELLKEREIK